MAAFINLPLPVHIPILIAEFHHFFGIIALVCCCVNIPAKAQAFNYIPLP